MIQYSLDFVYPPRCPLCGGLLPPHGGLRRESPWNRLVCADCAGKLPWIREPLCKKCGRPLEEETEEYCPECTGRQLHFTEGRCVFPYKGALRDSVLRMKFHNRREYLDFFAASMAYAQKSFLDRIQPDVIVPVPMNPRKRRERGFDQCLLLAERFSERTGIRLDRDLLVRTRHTSPQKGLDLSRRRANVHGAFAVRKGRQVPQSILLVDDIFTTGSTVGECSRTLKNAGVKQVYFLILCAGVFHDSGA